jgi:hypothetical protein
MGARFGLPVIFCPSLTGVFDSYKRVVFLCAWGTSINGAGMIGTMPSLCLAKPSRILCVCQVLFEFRHHFSSEQSVLLDHACLTFAMRVCYR